LGQGIRLASVGLLTGLADAIALSRLLAGSLYGVSATDPLALGGAAAFLLIVAGLACCLPALRAARVNPLVALRCE
jgi:ABC-type antimicrobial peptide transport system permease subunit